MTEQEVSIALRYATHEQRQAVFAILRKVDLPKPVPQQARQLYDVAGEILGTVVGFDTRHAAQVNAHVFVVEAYRRAGYNARTTAQALGIREQRIPFYRRRARLWRSLPSAYAQEVAQLDQFLDIVTKKHIL